MALSRPTSSTWRLAPVRGLPAEAAVAEFGDLALVVGEFTRRAPSRRAARMLLTTGPVAGACWAAVVVSGHAWRWPVPDAARLGTGMVLLLAVTALAVAASSRHGYRRTRLALAACPVIVVLDAAGVTAALLKAPALTWVLGDAVAVSLTRIAFLTWILPRLMAG